MCTLCGIAPLFSKVFCIDCLANRKKLYLDKRTYLSEYYKSYYLRYRSTVFKLLGGKCLHCGFLDWRALQVDHILGNGAEERKRFKGNRYKQYKEVLAHPENYQLLCANCNWIKRHKEGTIGGTPI